MAKSSTSPAPSMRLLSHGERAARRGRRKRRRRRRRGGRRSRPEPGGEGGQEGGAGQQGRAHAREEAHVLGLVSIETKGLIYQYTRKSLIKMDTS